DMLLQEDLIQLLPMINEANAMSEELGKKVKFEIALVSSQALGLEHEKTEVMVKMKHMENENEWMFSRNDFINRKYLMQEMYANYMQGDEDWDVPQERDPFWEPPETEVLVGTVHVYLQSLGYMIELQENLAIADYRGTDQGHLSVEVRPCNESWDDIEEEYFIDNPAELIDRKIYFKLIIPFARGLPQRFASSWCKYKFFLEEKSTQTQVVSGTINPEYKHENKFQYTVTKQLIDYIAEKPLVIEIWGTQKGDSKTSKQQKSSPAKTAKDTKPAKVNDKKETANKNKEIKVPVQNSSIPVTEVASLNNKIQGLIENAQASGQSTIEINQLVNLLNDQQSTTTANNSSSKPADTKVSKACIIQ
ncbi:hypothetical protein LOTGIDRAFT_176099, partial [Lottia gigantea]